MNLQQTSIQVNRIYSTFRSHIFSLIEEKQLTQKQLDDLATKLDILGGGTVAQALIWQVESLWISFLMIIISFIFCAILWTTTFIMKGYVYEQRNRNRLIRHHYYSHHGLYLGRRRKSRKRTETKT